MTTNQKWTCVRNGENIKYEWNGYTIVSRPNNPLRWWIIQGHPAPYRDTFEYINDAKSACECASRDFPI